jgi:predicted transcriptional regulator of viral defense system
MDKEEIYELLHKTIMNLGLDEDQFFLLIRKNNIKSIKEVIEKVETPSSKYEHKIQQRVRNIFAHSNGIVKTQELFENNISTYMLKKLEEQGVITKLKRGLYSLSNNDSLDELTEASHLVPKGVICLYSALAIHELSTYTPDEYNFAISRADRKPSIPNYPPIKIFHFDDDTFQMGIQEHNKGGYAVKVYDRERTICDIVKYRNKLDANVVKEALNNYSNSKNKNYSRMLKYADKMRVRGILNNYLEVL